MKHERWYEYTTREINKTKKDKCINCKYSKRVGTSGSGTGNGRGAEMAIRNSGAKVNIGNIFCDYLSMTGHKRGCKPEDCPYFEERGK